MSPCGNSLTRLPETARPAGVPDSWPEHVKLMFDLQVLAIRADLTRVWTFLYGREATSMTFPHLNISMGHHEISHHNFEKQKLDALAKINVDQSQLFAYFLANSILFAKPIPLCSTGH